MKAFFQGMVLSVLALGGPAALAWNAEGHQTVGAIADSLLAGTHAGKEVRKILGRGGTLQRAALWADCAQGVGKNKKTGGYHYVVNPKFKGSAPFESAA